MIKTFPQFDGPDTTGNVWISIDTDDGHLLDIDTGRRFRFPSWLTPLGRIGRRVDPTTRVRVLVSRHAADLLLGRLGHTLAEIDADSDPEG